jgi:hypothetical protein
MLGKQRGKQMGYSYTNRQEQHAHEASLKSRGLDDASKKAAADKAISAGRNEMAMKITMAVVDRVVNEIIRPGPKPEERECYVMAGELRAITPELETLVRQIIDVNDGVA